MSSRSSEANAPNPPTKNTSAEKKSEGWGDAWTWVALDADTKAMEDAILADEQTQKYLEGKAPKKVIIVKGKIVNVVV